MKLLRKTWDKSLFQIMLNEILESCKNNAKMLISANMKTNVKQEIKKTGSCVLCLFTEVPSQNLKFNVFQACIFHLILVCIPCSLILSIRNS